MNLYQESFTRNIGIFTRAEQEKLKNSTIAVAGVGGVGGLLAERLTRLGVGSIKMTDMGTFELSNMNRQYGCSTETIDQYKTEVICKNLLDINPSAKILYNNNGINSYADAIQFVDGADLVIDEMDYGAWKESIYLQRAARKRGVYYVFAGAIGFGALLAIFDPRGMTLEEYNNISSDQDLELVGNLSVSAERVLPVTPSYITKAMSFEMLQEILKGQRPVPTCSIGVALASILAASNAVNILLGRKDIMTAPKFIYFDLMDQEWIVGSVTGPTVA